MHELPEETPIADILVLGAMRIPFSIHLVQQQHVIFPRHLWRGRVDRAVFPTEGAAVIGIKVGEKAGGVFVEAVAEVEAVRGGE